MTYFFNGGREVAWPGEERRLVPSARVATYDLQPEMSAAGVTDELVAAIESGRYDLSSPHANSGHGRPHGGVGRDDRGARRPRRRRGCVADAIERC